MAETRTDHDRIYLEPGCDPIGGDRMWCEDKIEDDWVEYVRADRVSDEDGRRVEPVAWMVEAENGQTWIYEERSYAESHAEALPKMTGKLKATILPLYAAPPPDSEVVGPLGGVRGGTCPHCRGHLNDDGICPQTDDEALKAILQEGGG